MPQPAQNMIGSVMYVKVKYPVTVEVFTSTLPNRTLDILQFFTNRYNPGIFHSVSMEGTL